MHKRNGESIIFLYIQNTLTFFPQKNRMDVIFWTLSMKMYFTDFICVSRFQSKCQNALSDSDEYSSYKLINDSCSVKYIFFKSVTKYEN